MDVHKDGTQSREEGGWSEVAIRFLAGPKLCENPPGHSGGGGGGGSCFWPVFSAFIIDDLRKSREQHSVSAFGHGRVYIGPCLRV